MDDLGDVFRGRVLAVERRQANVVAWGASLHDLPSRKRSSYEIVYPACVIQRSLVVLPASHEMMFVEVFEFGGFQNLSTVRQGRKIELFFRDVIRSDQGWWDIQDAPVR